MQEAWSLCPSARFYFFRSPRSRNHLRISLRLSSRSAVSNFPTVHS